MLKMNKPELIYIIFGCVACICNGGELRKVVSYENQICPCSGVQPAFGVILSKVERMIKIQIYIIPISGGFRGSIESIVYLLLS